MNPKEKILRHGVKEVICSAVPKRNCEDAAKFKSSSHYFREMCFCLEGLHRYMLNGSVYDCAPGSIIMIDRWEDHAFGYLPEDRNLLHLWIQDDENSGLQAGFVRVGLSGAYKHEFQRFKLSDDYMKILNKRWDAMSCDPNAGDMQTALKYIAGPVNAILDEVIFQAQDENMRGSGEDPVVESLKRHILSCNGRDCTLKHLEEFSGYNRFYISHRFKKSEKISIGDYIDKVRVSYTSAALRHGYSQKVIASELGFSSAANFWNWLQKHQQEISGETV